ncbi:hypothetical protein ACJMK2_025473, partial [Sinanodonta woodiana]
TGLSAGLNPPAVSSDNIHPGIKRFDDSSNPFQNGLALLRKNQGGREHEPHNMNIMINGNQQLVPTTPMFSSTPPFEYAFSTTMSPTPTEQWANMNEGGAGNTRGDNVWRVGKGLRVAGSGPLGQMSNVRMRLQRIRQLREQHISRNSNPLFENLNANSTSTQAEPTLAPSAKSETRKRNQEEYEPRERGGS